MRNLFVCRAWFAGSEDPASMFRVEPGFSEPGTHILFPNPTAIILRGRLMTTRDDETRLGHPTTPPRSTGDAVHGSCRGVR